MEIKEEFLFNITERDMDLLVLEELHSNSDFLQWFCDECTMAHDNIEFHGAWHSLVDSVYGESDLTLVITADNMKQAILIEDKIDAITMPEQSLRYRRRGERGIRDGHWLNYHTCMIAPQKYLDKLPSEEQYDSYVSYEKISAWFTESQSLNKERAFYKAKFIDAAIEKQKRTGAMPRDPIVEEFLAHYLDCLVQHYSTLTDPVFNGNWVTFNLLHISHFDIPVRLHHKITQGIVELEFVCTPEEHEALINTFAALQNAKRRFKKYSKYLGLRQDIKRIDIGGSFDNTEDDVRAALDAGIDMVNDLQNIISNE